MNTPNTDIRYSSLSALLKGSEFESAKQALKAAIARQSETLRGIRKPKSPEATQLLKDEIVAFQKNRGRDLYYPYLATGLGCGPFVELLDGSVKYDMIAGIGINFFGHSNPDFIDTMIDGLSADVMQGNLQPSVEAKDALQALLSRVGNKAELKHAWFTCSGTMANENALKILRQKKFPASRMFAFADCFAGRSTAMQEITDTPSYRQGQPVYGEVTHLPFHDPKLGVEASVARVNAEVKSWMDRYPQKYAGMVIEIVQGEGGFRFAPPEFYKGIFEFARKQGLVIWTDEVQTFGRTGELFAFQTFGLDEYVDIVTIGKLFQACAVLYTEEMNPRPGLVAGTFTGSSNTLRAARKALEILDRDGLLGASGKITKLSARFREGLEGLSKGACAGLIGELRILGGMIAFQPLDGKMESAKKLIFEMFDRGLVAYYCGHDPYFIRMLPPLAVMTDRDVDAVCAIIGDSLIAVSKGTASKGTA